MRWTSIDELTHTAEEQAGTHELVATMLGEAARADGDPVHAPLLAAHAAQHAWHAELWRRRRPAIPGVDPTSAPPTTPSWAQAGGTAVAVYGDAIPALLADAEARRVDTDERIDAPTARTLDLVVADLRAQLATAAIHELGRS